MGRKVEGIRFEFAGNNGSDMTTPRRGRIHCDICEESYKSPHIEVCLSGFTICPSCIKAGPAAVAAEAKRFAGDKDRIVRTWGYSNSNPVQEDIACMASGYRSLASKLRGLRSFEDLPGGKIALGVAEILKSSAARRKGKAA